MEIQVLSRLAFDRTSLVHPYALISFRDPFTPEVYVPPGCFRLDIVCHDIVDSCAGLVAPSQEMAHRVVDFVHRLPKSIPLLVIQCEAGVGRSVATAAALVQADGSSEAWRDLLRHGTHNRKLHALLLAELGLPKREEPLVALCVRVKYPLDRMQAFASCMKRQRYDNWRCLFVTDGPNRYAWDAMEGLHDSRFSFVETNDYHGLWGHPWRQVGINEGLFWAPAYIGLSNDDNYYCPGYLEQMVSALQDQQAQLVLCDISHSYSGWAVIPGLPKSGCADLGNWLAASELVRDTPWPGNHFTADGDFVESLAKKAKGVYRVMKPLFVKN